MLDHAELGLRDAGGFERTIAAEVFDNAEGALEGALVGGAVAGEAINFFLLLSVHKSGLGCCW